MTPIAAGVGRSKSILMIVLGLVALLMVVPSLAMPLTLTIAESDTLGLLLLPMLGLWMSRRLFLR